MTAEEIIQHLNLQKHPEGGYYIETFRDTQTCPDGRACSTAIYYLLRAGEISHWHRVDATEIWHFYAGADLELRIAGENGKAKTITLGSDLLAGAHPQIIVEKGEWQSARSLGNWTFVGCTVAPGFDFSGFEMAPENWAPPGF